MRNRKGFFVRGRISKAYFQWAIVCFFGVLLVALTSIFLLIRQNQEASLDSARWVQHTEDVLQHNQRLLNQARDMEAGAMRYLITGREDFLTPFNNSILLLPRSVKRLREMTGDNPEQRPHIDSMEKLLDANISVRKNLIALRRKGGSNAASKLFSTGITRNLMDSLRREVEHVQYNEEALLDAREAKNLRTTRRSERYVTIFGIITLLLAVASALVIHYYLKAQSRAEQQVRALNESLEKRVEEKTNEIREKERQYRFLLENMREGIQIIGYDWQYRFVNNTVVNQGKLSGDKLLGRTMIEAYPGIEETELFQVLKRCMKERVAENFENEFVFADGSKEWFELSIQPVPEGLFILSTDISARKQAEQSLRESEENFRTLVAVSPEAIFISQDYKVLYINRSGCDLLGFKDPEEIIGRNPLDFFSADTPESLETRKKIFRESNERLPFIEDKLINTNGETIEVEVASTRFNHKKGRALQVVIRDISERKRAEAELSRLNEDLKKYAAELLESNRELERFAYVASHDLQEPLRMVSSFLHLLTKRLGNNLDDTSRQYIHFAVDGAERMKKLIQDLLAYSRVSNTKEAVAQVNCNDVVATVIRFHELRLKELNGTINVKELPVISAVQSHIQQLFQNLVGNALKYHGDRAPDVEVGCTDEGSLWQFYVKDNGIGIDPKFFSKIFIIFQRLHNKSEYSGTGIGLAICKKIVEQYGGNIWVTSKPGAGSTFYFTIPKKTNG